MSIAQLVDWKLITIFIVASLTLGVIVGLLVNETAKFKARSDPETYQFFQRGDYVSIRYEKYFPDFDMTFLNAFNEYSFVVVERDGGTVISETYYNQLGDHEKVTYRDNKWIGTGSSVLSWPMYAINCLIPLVGGFFCGLFIPGVLFYQTGIEENSGLGLVVNAVAYYSFHLFCAGVISFFAFYLIPGWISLFGAISRGGT